jgi:hypothetical protein
MTQLKIEAGWLPPAGKSALDVTLAKLRIEIGAVNVTAYAGEDEPDGDHLELPVYPLAEWIAENFWALLHEPRKSEAEDNDERDPDFRMRHSLLAAQGGFVLPRVLLVPTGDAIHVTASRYRPAYSSVRFRNAANAFLPRIHVAGVLKHFMEHVVRRVEANGLRDTPLQEAYELIVGTDDEEMPFCRLMGALGLSPYHENRGIEAALIDAEQRLGSRATLDLALSATPDTFTAALRLATAAEELTRRPWLRSSCHPTIQACPPGGGAFRLHDAYEMHAVFGMMTLKAEPSCSSA